MSSHGQGAFGLRDFGTFWFSPGPSAANKEAVRGRTPPEAVKEPQLMVILYNHQREKSNKNPKIFSQTEKKACFKGKDPPNIVKNSESSDFFGRPLLPGLCPPGRKMGDPEKNPLPEGSAFGNGKSGGEKMKSLPVSLGRGDFKLWRNPVGENRKKTKRRPAPGMIAPGPAPGEGGERRRLVRTISCFSPINLRREAAPGGGG